MDIPPLPLIPNEQCIMFTNPPEDPLFILSTLFSFLLQFVLFSFPFCFSGTTTTTRDIFMLTFAEPPQIHNLPDSIYLEYQDILLHPQIKKMPGHFPLYVHFAVSIGISFTRDTITYPP